MGSPVHNLYRIATLVAAPFVPLWLDWRKYKGKEDAKRLGERYGFTSQPRPPGLLVWLHAASVGEANSILALIGAMATRFPKAQLLITTGTVTSAALMQRRLPSSVIHQYVPVDTPMATMRFIRHWKPDIAFWVESELWPNLIYAAKKYYCFMGIINGRMSEKSFELWQKYPGISRPMLESFSLVFPQSEQDGERFRALGVKPQNLIHVGNMKYDGAQLSCDENELLRLSGSISERPHFLAASTHPGEEELIASTHSILAATRPDLLTVIAPRHARRGAEIAAALAPVGRVALRSRGDAITSDTKFYIADTMGELGLFFRLCEITFMGGSLVPHGGQNPLEAARLSCAILAGTHTHNFSDIYQEMEQVGACLRVKNAAALAGAIDNLLNNNAKLASMQATAKNWVDHKGGATKSLLEILTPILEAAPVL